MAQSGRRGRGVGGDSKGEVGSPVVGELVADDVGKAISIAEFLTAAVSSGVFKTNKSRCGSTTLLVVFGDDLSSLRFIADV